MAAPISAGIVKYKARSFATSWSRTFIKRHLQTTSHVAEDTYESGPEPEDHSRGYFTQSDPETEQIVLDFFNNCDNVSLKKLINKKSYLLQFVDPASIIRRGNMNRFKNFKEACDNIPGLIAKRSKIFAEVIQQQREDEEKYLGIEDLHPRLYREDVKDVERVVAVEVFQNEIAWAEETRDRTLVSVGHDILIPDVKNYTFNHLKYPHRIVEVVEKIPHSPVYLMCQGSASGIKMASHTSILMQHVITMLNMRSQLGDAPFTHHRTVSALIARGVIPSNVHMMRMKAFNDFYDVMFKLEVLSHAFKFSHWAGMRRSPFAKLELSDEMERTLTEGLGRDLMTKCVMMTDIFCRCLNKSDKFPRMYQYA